MRKLARIEIIDKLEPIEGADKIEVATVGGWKVVVQKDLHKAGDKVIYCEIDSFLPIKPEYEFLRKSSYKKLADGTEGFRLKTIRLRGQISQGLILPLGGLAWALHDKPVGYEVTTSLEITKYEPPIPANLAGKVIGQRPFNVPKTDEERIQNLTNELENWKGLHFYISEKLDGSSMSVYYLDGKFGVCSRNLELERDENNTLWKVALSLDLEKKLTDLGKNITLQGELVGEGVQGNPYKLKGQRFYVFNVFNPTSFKYYNFYEAYNMTIDLAIPFVPIVEMNYELNDTMTHLLEMAAGRSRVDVDTQREGIVFRTKNRDRVSFKVISNDYLLGEKE